MPSSLSHHSHRPSQCRALPAATFKRGVCALLQECPGLIKVLPTCPRSSKPPKRTMSGKCVVSWNDPVSRCSHSNARVDECTVKVGGVVTSADALLVLHTLDRHESSDGQPSSTFARQANGADDPQAQAADDPGSVRPELAPEGSSTAAALRTCPDTSRLALLTSGQPKAPDSGG